MTDDWLRRANCVGVDPDLFFPERGDMAAIREAKAICAGCTARTSCLEANLHELEGIWGGTTRIERQRMRGARRRLA